MGTFGVTSTTALRQTVLFDYAPKKHRARWSALDSISSLGWSGSAMVGGILVDKFGYHVTFFVTAGMHLTSVLIRTPLLLWCHETRRKTVARHSNKTEALIVKGKL